MRLVDGAIDEVRPGAGAVVMGTGIVSMALALDGRLASARVLLVVTAIAWAVLAAVLGGRFLSDRPRIRSEARSPGSLTGVAGTAVLGARLVQLGWPGGGLALLAVSVVLWAILMPGVLAGIERPAHGDAFMVTVATAGIAGLAATAARAEHSRWLEYVAAAFAVAGLALYPWVLVRFDLGQLRIGKGDHWVVGGSLAISALALGQIAEAASRLGSGGTLLSICDDAALAVWAVAAVWLPPLVACELRWPRLRYETRRWATVFPLGMYAACSFSVAGAAMSAPLGDFAKVWVWVAAAVWVLVFAAMTASITGFALRATRKRPAAERQPAEAPTTRRASRPRRAR